MLVSLFKNAGANGHVFFLSGGKVRDKGLAYSGLIGPMTTVAVVPTTPQIIDFAINAQTEDKQQVVVRGNLTATLTPNTAVTKFDFTVDTKSGGYTGDWLQVVKARVIERVLRVVHDRVMELDVEAATRSQQSVEDAVTNVLTGDAFATDGITIDSCSIPKIEPRDSDVREAIGATERQAMLADADKALHTRRMDAAENERTLQEYEADTELELERKKSELLDESAKNEKKQAESDAEATEIRLAPLNDVASGKLLGAALIEAAKSGRFGSMSVTTDLLAALNQGAS